jgi:hypothetical protein
MTRPGSSESIKNSQDSASKLLQYSASKLQQDVFDCHRSGENRKNAKDEDEVHEETGPWHPE